MTPVAPDDTFARPAFSKVVLSFAIGIAIAAAMLVPVVRDDLVRIGLSNPGPVGNVLLIGVLSMVVVTTGLFALYRLFWLVDR